MATVNKDFKIKSGLIVEGTNATVNGNQILTENAGDQYILDLIGGETLVKSVSNEFDVSGAGELSIDRAIVDAYYDAVGDADLAEAAANLYTDGRETAITNAYEAYADQAEVDAKAYTDTRETAITTAYQNYADAAETDAKAYTDTRETAITNAYEAYADQAEADAKSYADGIVGTVSGDLSAHESDTSTHGVTGDIVGTTDTQTLSNKTLGSDLAAGGYKVSGLMDPSANQDAATKAYVDGAVADLVNGAPELLDTLNELAAAIGDDDNFVTTVTSSSGEKVAKAGDSMTGDLDFGGTHSVTSLRAPNSSSDAATKGYVDGEISTLDTAAQGYANGAETDANAYTDGRETAITTAYQSYADTAEADAVTTANSYTDGEITDALLTAQGYATTAEQNAIAHADALTTSDVAEGTAQYFTDARAKTSAADLLTGANLTNITITGSGAGLTITAENGVADSTTDNLVEGTTNKYFTNARVLDAINDATEIEPQAIDITWVRRENATWTNVPSASQVVCHQAGAGEGSMKYLVRVTANVGGTQHSHVTELLATVDGSRNVAVVEYGTIYTSTNPMATATVLWNGLTNCYELNVTTANNNSEVMVAATMLAYQD